MSEYVFVFSLSQMVIISLPHTSRTVDGVFQEWQEWAGCSTSCGPGRRLRERPCVPPKFGGKACPGQHEEEEQCEQRPCPTEDGHWSHWSLWEPCSVTCGGEGDQRRYRVCNSGLSGVECEGGQDEERQSCSYADCPGRVFLY